MLIEKEKYKRRIRTEEKFYLSFLKGLYRGLAHNVRIFLEEFFSV
jgi:hypothetical protein